MFALFAPVLVLVMSFVLDAGNLFSLQSHLQLQADAGALAAAQDFSPCSDATITADVHKYSGLPGSAGYNGQVDNGASGILESINSTIYPGPVPGTPDNTNTAPPCTASAVDVKISDTNIPWYFRIFGASSINAHARVVVGQETSIGPGAVPLAINDPVPTSAAACFVDESSGNVLASTPLTRNGNTWSNATALPVAIKQRGIAVRVALSANASASCSSFSSTTYDTSDPRVGILHISGWRQSNTGTAGSPVAHQVTLTPGGCTDQYFSAPTGNCTVGIQASVDYGSSSKPSGATVSAVVAGTSYPLTFVSTAGTVETWTGSGLSIPPANGPNSVDLRIGSTGHSTVTVSNVQSSYTAGPNSGPITAAFVSENGVNDADAFRMCESGFTACTHNLVVTISIPALSANSLQVLTPANAAECPPPYANVNFTTLIATGCPASFAVNTGNGCSTSAPYNCLSDQDNVDEDQISNGLNERILGTPPPGTNPPTCTSPNHWALYPNLPVGDPRLITIFFTSFGSLFDNQPIEAFATFYVTGWSGDLDSDDGANPCQPPRGGDAVAARDTVVGHVINYVNVLGTSASGPCNPNGIAQCTVILTR